MPDAVGVPEIVITSEAQAALTPAGNPVAVPIPVALVVASVILVNAVLIHSVGVLDATPAAVGNTVAGAFWAGVKEAKEELEASSVVGLPVMLMDAEEVLPTTLKVRVINTVLSDKSTPYSE